MAKIGTAYVEIKPDLTGFTRSLREELAKRQTVAVKVAVKPDLTGFTRDLRARLSTSAIPSVRVDVEPNTRGFLAELRRQIAVIQVLAPDLKIHVEPDVDVLGPTLRRALTRPNVRRAISDSGEDVGNLFTRSVSASISAASEGSEFTRAIGKMFKLPPGGPVMLLIGAAAIALATEFILALTAALVGLGAGLSLVILGIFGAAWGDKEIADKAKSLGKIFMDTLKETTASFKVPVLASLDIIFKALNESLVILKPALDELAPMLPVLAESFGEFFKTLATSLAKPENVESFKSLIGVLAQHLPEIAAGLGSIFDTIGKNRATLEWVLGGSLKTLAGAFNLLGWMMDESLGDLQEIRDGWHQTRLTIQWVVEWWVRIWHTATDEMATRILGFLASVEDGWNRFTAFVSELWKTIKEAFTEGINTVVDEAGKLPDRLVGALISLPGQLWSLGFQALVGFGQGMSGGLGWAMNVVRSIPSMIIGSIGYLGSLLYNAGVQVVQGFINGMWNMLPSVTAAAQRIWDAVPEVVKKVLELGSPSKLFYRFGQDTVQGYILGMEDRMPDVPRIGVPGINGAALAGPASPILNSVNYFKVLVGGEEFDAHIQRRVDVSNEEMARLMFTGRSGV